MIIYKTSGEAYTPTTEAPANWNLYYPTVGNAGNGTQNSGSNATISTSGLTAFTGTGGTLPANFVWYAPMIFSKTRVLTKLGIVINSAVAGNAIMGVYGTVGVSATGLTARTGPIPGPLLATTASVSVASTGPWLQSLTASVTLTANTIYWLAFHHNAATLQFVYQGSVRSTGFNNTTGYNTYYRQSLTYAGTLPANASGVVAINAFVPVHLLGWQ